jgi:hypothetical protein
MIYLIAVIIVGCITIAIVDRVHKARSQAAYYHDVHDSIDEAL